MSGEKYQAYRREPYIPLFYTTRIYAHLIFIQLLTLSTRL